MSKITIISGCPGSGKSTLSVLLASQHQNGIRIETDRFYHFLAHRLDPSTPESKPQNTAVVRAFTSAARSFQDDGFEVYIDGVIGPWWLDTIREQLASFDCVYLHADLDTVVRRTSKRSETTQTSASPELVRIMHSQFDGLAELATRSIHTTNKDTDSIVDEFLTRQAAGDFS